MSDYSAYGMTELLYEAADTSASLGDAVRSPDADGLFRQYDEIMTELERRIEESKQPTQAARIADDRVELAELADLIELHKNTMTNTAVIIYQPDATPDYPYNLQIYTDGYYCGNGRFCKSEDEALMYAKGSFGVSEERISRIGFERAAAKPPIGREEAKAIASAVSESRFDSGRAHRR